MVSVAANSVCWPKRAKLRAADRSDTFQLASAHTTILYPVRRRNGADRLAEYARL